MQRYYINKEQINNNFITITGSDVHHIKNVMRMVVGDNVNCVTSDGFLYTCEIISIGSDVSLKVLNTVKENNELNGSVTIAQGLVRREKTEEVVRRLVELGCSKYIRCEMIRSIVKKNDDKIERLETIVKEASEQSHRNKLMDITKTYSFKEILNSVSEYDECYFADCNSNSTSVYDLNYDLKGKNVLILVGPEGGFDKNEVELLEKAGFKSLVFGNRILRTETAPLYIMSVLSFLMGENNEN